MIRLNKERESLELCHEVAHEIGIHCCGSLHRSCLDRALAFELDLDNSWSDTSQLALSVGALQHEKRQRRFLRFIEDD